MNNKPTIVYIGGFELPDKNAAAHRVLSNSKVLRSLGNNVVLIGIDRNDNEMDSIFDAKTIVQGFECYSIRYPTTYFKWFHYLSNIDNIIKIIASYQNVKAIICYDYQAFALYRIMKYCRLNGIFVIADCCEWYKTKKASLIFKIIKGADTFIRMRYLHKRVDGLIVISKYLENYYSMCKNVVRIPPLVDLSEDKWNVKSEHVQQNITQLIYAGNPGDNKDKIGVIINLLAKLNPSIEYKLRIIGISREEFEKNYPEEIENLVQVQKSILFLGRISHVECIKHIQKSDFSIFLRENSRLSNAGFPTKYVESISCGTPIITNKTSDLSEYLVIGNNGFFLEKDHFEDNMLKLTAILTMKMNEKLLMRNYCLDSRIFEFQNFISLFSKLLSNLS